MTNELFRERDTFSPTGENCQLTALAVDSILTSDLRSDRDWNVYERLFDSRCNDGGGGGDGGNCAEMTIESYFQYSLPSTFPFSFLDRDWHLK